MAWAAVLGYSALMSLNLFWASPLPPVRSGVSDYAVELLRPLSVLAKIRVVKPPGLAGELELPPDLDVEIVDGETRPTNREIPVVHMGNNPYHEWIIDRCPDAVVVVHDFVLHHLLVESQKGADSPDVLSDALAESHGPAGRALAEAREFGFHGRLDPFLFPANVGFLRHARGLICHSVWAKDLLEKALPMIPVGLIGLPVADPRPVDRAIIRKGLGLRPDETVLMHLGFLTREKGIDVVLAGLAAAVRIGVNVRLLLVGDLGSDDGFRRVAASLGVADRVLTTGWISWQEMVKVPAAADLGVALRTPSAGETSAAVLRFLACGTPVAVIGERQFLEWPEKVAPRITPGPSAAADIVRVLTHKILGEHQRLEARGIYEQNHRPEMAAHRLLDFLNTLKGKTSGR